MLRRNPDIESIRSSPYPYLDRILPGQGGYRGPDHSFQADSNAYIEKPHWGSNRDDQSLPEVNGNATRSILVNMEKTNQNDVNVNEVIFTIPSRIVLGKELGGLAQAEHVMGLAKLNEWLRTSPEGLEFGKYNNGSYLAKAICLRGVNVTSMEQAMLRKDNTKAITVVFNGRTTIGDITAWTRGELDYKNQTSSYPLDHVSICFRRIMPQNPLAHEHAAHFQPYWQAIPERHKRSTPDRSLYASTSYLSESKDSFLGFYFPLGYIRSIVFGHDQFRHNVNEKAYNYCFCKDGQSMEHISYYNQLPQLELFVKMAYV